MNSTIESLLYLSESNLDNPKKEIVELYGNSTTRNQHYGITGFIYYREPYFIQYVEGTSANVYQLCKNILHDPRHRVKQLLNDREKKNRRFDSFVTQHFYSNSLNKDAQATALLIMDTLVLALRSFTEQRLPLDGHTQQMIFEKIDNLANMYAILNRYYTALDEAENSTPKIF